MSRYTALFLVLALSICAAASRAGEVSAPAVAEPSQDSAPAAVAPAPTASAAVPEAPAASPAAPTTALAAPEVKPVEKPAQAKPKEEPAKAPEEKPVEKPLQASAAKLQPVADSYQKAHDDFMAWLRSASEKLAAVEQKIADLKSKITENEAKITKLKVDSAPAPQARGLEAQTKGLWDQLKAEQDRRDRMSRALGRAAEQKVRELNESASGAVETASAQLR
ncbi:MAG: hypothetical protein NTY77_13105 [Elusimicrobia bacterium]|nr:hypothetical protein [Elusimicrobiota bacterium]